MCAPRERGFRDHVTVHEVYGPAMRVRTQADADEYFERLVRHHMSFGYSRERAERVERHNLYVFAGYQDRETNARVQRLYRCGPASSGLTSGDSGNQSSL